MSEETIVSEPLRESSVPQSLPEEDDQRRTQKETVELKSQHAAEISALKEQVAALQDAVKESLSADRAEPDVSDVPNKTAGIKELRVGTRSVLATAASQAHRTGSRGDVQEYMRLRRKFV